MKRTSLFALFFAIAAVSAVSIGIATADAIEEADDIDIIMSDMPLSGLDKMKFNVEDEHQANDLGVVPLIIEWTRCDMRRI